MRRADRLFQVVQMLRSGRLTTAMSLAERLEVSERTIYRDIADLQSTGVPIDGEAGVGYVMGEGYDLPPLMFTRDEIVALVVGARMVRGWGGVAMARAAEEALSKIEAVLPDEEKSKAADAQIYAPAHRVEESVRALIDLCDRAIDAKEVLTLDYEDEKGKTSQRDVWPLGLWFWGHVWTLVGWCELRDDFRMFRLDRVQNALQAGRTFKPSPQKSLAECLRRFEQEHGPKG